MSEKYKVTRTDTIATLVNMSDEQFEASERNEATYYAGVKSGELAVRAVIETEGKAESYIPDISQEELEKYREIVLADEEDGGTIEGIAEYSKDRDVIKVNCDGKTYYIDLPSGAAAPKRGEAVKIIGRYGTFSFYEEADGRPSYGRGLFIEGRLVFYNTDEEAILQDKKRLLKYDEGVLEGLSQENPYRQREEKIVTESKKEIELLESRLAFDIKKIIDEHEPAKHKKKRLFSRR
ncbi:MAG: hypothetical protein WCP03_02080 [Candidatus Saccharibacteria bacterium]